MKKILAILTLMLACFSVHSKDKPDDGVLLQNVEVSRQQTKFVINYDLSLGEEVRSCNVALLLSTDAGRTFKAVDKEHLSGDVGRVGSSGAKTIEYDFSQQVRDLADKELSFKVEVSRKDIARKDIARKDFLAAGQVAVYPHLSYGIMVGMVKKFGWYAKLRSDFSSPSYSYTRSSTEGSFWGTGETRIYRLNATAGIMARVGNIVCPYFGAGYGSYGLCCEDADGDWVGITDYSTKGLSLDAGVALKFGSLAITAGISNTMFKYTEAEIGIGLFF